jgi:tetratricopeptide (TPR) repeat protein
MSLLAGCGGDTHTWADRAQEAMDEGRAGPARRAVKRSLKLDPDNAMAWRISCILAYDTGRFADSAADCTRALELTEPAPEYHALLNRGLARIKLNQLDGAFDDFQRCKKLEPQNAEAYYDESWVWAARGDLDRVIENVRLAGTYNPFYAYRGVVEPDLPYNAFRDDPTWNRFLDTLVPGEAPVFPKHVPLLVKNPVDGVPMDHEPKGQ